MMQIQKKKKKKLKIFIGWESIPKFQKYLITCEITFFTL